MPKFLKLSFFLLILGLGLLENLPLLEPRAEALPSEEVFSGLPTIEDNTLSPLSALPAPKVVRKIMVVVTAYSSTTFQTDEDPYITAVGTRVREGIVANNLFPFGTKIRLPELYGDKVFVVEDRMNRKKGDYHFDIWFSSYGEAKNFGAKNTYVEILAN